MGGWYLVGRYPTGQSFASSSPCDGPSYQIAQMSFCYRITALTLKILRCTRARSETVVEEGSAERGGEGAFSMLSA